MRYSPFSFSRRTGIFLSFVRTFPSAITLVHLFGNCVQCVDIAIQLIFNSSIFPIQLLFTNKLHSIHNARYMITSHTFVGVLWFGSFCFSFLNLENCGWVFAFRGHKHRHRQLQEKTRRGAKTNGCIHCRFCFQSVLQPTFIHESNEIVCVYPSRCSLVLCCVAS